MNSDARPPGSSVEQIYATLLNLARQARHAGSLTELGFMAVNDSHLLAPYRQAALWWSDDKVVALSGVVQLEANAPYVQWLEQVCRALHRDDTAGLPREIDPAELPPALARDWAEWLPAHALWMPFDARTGDTAPGAPTMATTPAAAASRSHPVRGGGLLLARDTPWDPREIAVLTEWLDIWRCAWCAMRLRREGGWTWRLARLGRAAPGTGTGRRFGRRAFWVLLAAAALCIPVRLTVLVPGELVPANPAVIRAPQDGVVGTFFVKPNAIVTSGQPLFDLDSNTLTSRLEVAQQSLGGAEAELRQSAQLAVSDGKYKGQLAVLNGKVEERRAEVDYLRGQLERAHVVAPQDGMALFDDPTEWIGKPVATGERIMRVATPDDVEIEAWLPVGDAIPLDNGADVTLYLNATPLSPVAAQIRYLSHDALQRPDGQYAYRVRATLARATAHRVGAKGTAKLAGGRAPLFYWVARKPLAALRQWLGF